MRLSGLVVASILLASLTLLAQHSSGGGGSSSGGSHGGYSGASSSIASSSGSHSSSGPAGQVAGTGASSRSASPKASSTKAGASPEGKSSRSFWHPFRKTTLAQSAEFKRPVSCLKGRCPVCPPGEARHGNGACVVASNVCSLGQAWNGFSCGSYPFNDCSALAAQLAAQRDQMLEQDDYGQSLRYRLLRDQYEQCLMRSRFSFGAYAFSDPFLFDLP